MLTRRVGGIEDRERVRRTRRHGLRDGP